MRINYMMPGCPIIIPDVIFARKRHIHDVATNIIIINLFRQSDRNAERSVQQFGHSCTKEDNIINCPTKQVLLKKCVVSVDNPS